MGAVKPADLLFYAGGECWQKYGTLLRRTMIRGRGGEGLVETFTRADAATVASYVDREGYLRQALANVPRVEFVDLDGDGVRETASLLLEGARTNLCPRSQATSAGWTSAGTGTVTDDAVALGKLSLTGFNDTGGGDVFELFNAAALAFTGDGPKGLSVFCKKGASPHVDGALLSLRDYTAGMNRLAAIITFNAAGVPAVAMGTGTLLRTEALGLGVYRLLFLSAAVTVANDNRFRIQPAFNGAGATGDVYLGGFQAEDLFPSSYILTGAAAVTRAADSCTFPLNFGTGLTASHPGFTTYAKLARPLHAEVVGTLGNLYPGWLRLSTVSPRLYGYFEDLSRTLTAIIRTAGGDATASLALPAGNPLEIVCQYRTPSTAASVAIDVGTGLSSFVTGSADEFAALGNTTLELAGDAPLFGGLLAVKVARGLFTMAEMREAAP